MFDIYIIAQMKMMCIRQFSPNLRIYHGVICLVFIRVPKRWPKWKMPVSVTGNVLWQRCCVALVPRVGKLVDASKYGH